MQLEVEREEVEAVKALPDLERANLGGEPRIQHVADVLLHVRLLPRVAAPDVEGVVLVVPALVLRRNEVDGDVAYGDSQRDVLPLHLPFLGGEVVVEILVELFIVPLQFDVRDTKRSMSLPPASLLETAVSLANDPDTATDRRQLPAHCSAVLLNAMAVT